MRNELQETKEILDKGQQERRNFYAKRLAQQETFRKEEKLEAQEREKADPLSSDE
jgi:hypothetical protein